MIFNFRGFILWLMLLVFNGMNVFSQQTETRIISDSLREVQVTEQLKKKEIRSILPVQQMNATDFSKLSLLQTSDAVKFFSGVNVKDYGGIGGLKTVSVRSLGAGHTAVSYDGIKVSDMQTGQIDIGKFSMEKVELITLNNGQPNDIFQPAALFASAALLNIKTIKPVFEKSRSFHTKMGIKAGSFGLLSPSMYFDKKITDKLSGSFSAEWLSANGQYPFKLYYTNSGKDSSSIEIRKNTDVKNLRLEATFFADFSAKSGGYWKTSFYNSERGLPGPVILYNTDNSKQRLKEQNFFTQAHFLTKLDSRFEVQANLKYSRDNSDFSQLRRDSVVHSHYMQQEVYGSACSFYKVNQNLSFSLSGDLSYNSMESDMKDFVYPSRVTSLSVLAGKYMNEWLTVGSSLLYTNTNDKVKSGLPMDAKNKLSPYAGFSVKPFSKIDLRFRAFYKNIFRLPTFNDLYYVNFGSRSLKPEDVNQFNLGVTYALSYGKLKSFTFTLDAYRNEVKNKIVAFPRQNLFLWTVVNYGKVDIKGADVNLSCQIQLPDSIFLTLNNSYTYQLALDKTPESVIYNNQLPYTPRISGAGSAVFDLKYFTAAYTILWAGKRYHGFENFADNAMQPYSEHSISLSKVFSIKNMKLETGLQVQNLSGKNYEIVKWYYMPGRNFRASATLKF